MNERGFNRRQWIRGFGVSLALPMLARDLDAQESSRLPDEERPMRMVCVANPLGFVADEFFRRKL